jgi:membrane-bound metal-dependent hydrolase YbcI (DUF457 family)
MGPAHAASGLAAGALTLPLATHFGVDTAVHQVAWVLAWGGCAYLPDLDQHGSTAGSMWGAPTRVLSRAIGFLAVRHRGGTHDLVVAPITFGGVAALASLSPWPALVVLALAIGLALRAAGGAVGWDGAKSAVLNVLASFGLAWWLTTSGNGVIGWLPVAVAGGVVVHILGDALTTDGVPVPFQTWTRKHPRTVGLRLFDAGKGPEPLLRVLVFPVLTVVGLYLHTGLGDPFRPLVHAVVAQAAT